MSRCRALNGLAAVACVECAMALSLFNFMPFLPLLSLLVFINTFSMRSTMVYRWFSCYFLNVNLFILLHVVMRQIASPLGSLDRCDPPTVRVTIKFPSDARTHGYRNGRSKI